MTKRKDMKQQKSELTKQEISDKWAEIIRMAEEFGFVYHSYGGVALLLHPDVQKEQGVYEQVQYACGRGEHPQTIKLAKQ